MFYRESTLEKITTYQRLKSDYISTLVLDLPNETNRRYVSNTIMLSSHADGGWYKVRNIFVIICALMLCELQIHSNEQWYLTLKHSIMIMGRILKLEHVTVNKN